MTMTQTVLITGANGFIGQALCKALEKTDFTVITAGRRRLTTSLSEHRPLPDLSLDELMISPTLFEGVDQVVHLAALAHRDHVDAPSYHRVNHQAVVTLAKAAADAGCKRFVFLSTAKVLGETGHHLTDDSPPIPPDAYSAAKYAAEQDLAALAAARDMATISLRPPLVHAPEAKANLARLAALINEGGLNGLPLPLGRTENNRSVISRDSLINAIITVLNTEEAISGAYLIADQPTLATDAIIRHLAEGMGKKAPVFNIAPSIVRALLQMLGKQGLADRLLGDFSLDDYRFRRDFGWAPAADSAQGLVQTGRGIAARRA